ncbi:MAG TPA: hypothetical protein VIJ43_09230 [Burkholderiales bacterium]
MSRAFGLTSLLALLLLGACTTVPSGPGVMALPGTGKSFDQFRADDFDCRQYASYQVGGTTPSQTATDSGVSSAAVGTLVGAAAGAAIGGSRGAGVGAGTGLAAGALAGTGAAEGSAYGLQRRYDYAYIQCMYARGHKVPVSGNFTSSNPNLTAPNTPPPPPPGSPPPPPPPPETPPSR